MIARVAEWTVDLERADEVLGRVPGMAGRYRLQPGCRAFTVLVDRVTGDCIGFSLWDDHDAEQASRALSVLSQGEATKTGAREGELDVRLYDVVHHEEWKSRKP